MTKATAYGTIKNGKLSIDNKKRFEQDCREFRDGPVELTVKKKGTRSSQANRWYWGVLIQEIRIRLNDLGNRFDADTIHAWLKSKFNPVSVCDKDGVVIGELPGTTTEMNREEFSEYCDKIIQWAAQNLEITIGAPGEILQFNF